MKAYLFSLGAGVMVGVIYALVGVRSPAPPIIALLGLAGILFGEQVVPIGKRWLAGRETAAFIRHDCRRHVLGKLPSNQVKKKETKSPVASCSPAAPRPRSF